MTTSGPTRGRQDQALETVPSRGLSRSTPNDPGQVATITRAETILLTLVGLAILAFAWPVIGLIVQVYEDNPDYSHGYLIPLVAAYACYITWKEHPAITLRSSWQGLPLVFAGAFLVILGLWHKYAFVYQINKSLGSQFLAGLGLWLCIAGLLLSLLERKTFRLYRFSVLYLLFAIPLPGNITQRVVVTLRTVVSHWSEVTLNALGILAFREGNLIHLTNVTLGIEDACSGIRSLWVMVAWSVAAAWITGCRRGRFLLIVALAFPLAIAQNLLRVLLSAILANYIDPLWAEGWRHETVGWITFVMAAAAFVVIANVVAGTADASDQATEQQGNPTGRRFQGNPPAHFSGSAVPLYTVTLALLWLATVGNAAIHQRYFSVSLPPDPDRRGLSSLPKQIGEFRFKQTLGMPDSQLDILAPTDRFSALYEDRSGHEIGLVLLYWASGQRTASGGLAAPHDPGMCLPGSGWGYNPALDFPPPISASNHEFAFARVYSKSDQDRLLLFWWNQHVSPPSGGTLQNLLRRFAVLIDSLRHPQPHNSIKYSVYVFSDIRNSFEESLSEVSQFAPALKDVLKDYGMNP